MDRVSSVVAIKLRRRISDEGRLERHAYPKVQDFYALLRLVASPSYTDRLSRKSAGFQDRAAAHPAQNLPLGWHLQPDYPRVCAPPGPVATVACAPQGSRYRARLHAIFRTGCCGR